MLPTLSLVLAPFWLRFCAVLALSWLHLGAVLAFSWRSCGAPLGLWSSGRPVSSGRECVRVRHRLGAAPAQSSSQSSASKRCLKAPPPPHKDLRAHDKKDAPRAAAELAGLVSGDGSCLVEYKTS